MITKIPGSNTEHYKWGNGCEGWHLLKTDSLNMIKERMPPGTSEQLHYHVYAQQVFYILSGKATFELDGELIDVNKDESLVIPKGVKHKVANEEKEDLIFLLISEPRAQNDRMNLLFKIKSGQHLR